MLEETVPQAYWKARHVHVSLVGSSRLSPPDSDFWLCFLGGSFNLKFGVDGQSEAQHLITKGEKEKPGFR